MNHIEQINNAIAAHGLWKARLRQAIETGKSDFTPSAVKPPNNCEFGKWLYGSIAENLKNTEYYRKVVKLHAEFHVEAARILQLAIDGNKDEAMKGLQITGKYVTLSASLTSLMVQWKKFIEST